MGQDQGQAQKLLKEQEGEGKAQKGRYEGECDDLGRPHGKGKMFYASDSSSFDGQFKEGKRHSGRLTLKNNDYYDGYFNEDSQPHGDGIWSEKAVGVFRGLFANGQLIKGEVDYSDGSKFKGTMLKGKKHGDNCEFLFPDGDKFAGEFKDDQFKHGTFESKNGMRYTGSFLNGLKEGKGKYFLKSLAEYEGEFHQDEFHGFGKLKNFKNNTEYEGMFEMGQKEGKGLIREANGTVYEGVFHKNEKSGAGQYKFKDKTYEGQFLGGKFHGFGKLTYGNGDVYEGSFLNGKKEGHGKLALNKSRDSFSYEGMFKDDKIDGKGQLTYANGDTYNGSFTDNKKNGAGVYQNRAKGEIYQGTWTMDVKNGKFLQIKKKENLKSTGNYVNGDRHGKFIYQDLTSGNEARSQEWVNGKLIYNK